MRHWLLVCSTVLLACTPDGDQGARQQPARVESAASETQPAGAVIDSALPIAEHLRRFRIGLDSTERLEGGSPTPRQLAEQLLQAVSTRDTMALARLLVSRREFAWVYYPRHIYRGPPYELDPGTFWTLIRGNSDKGFHRVVRRYGGRRLILKRLECAPGGNVVPPLREMERCRVEFDVDATRESRRMFGSIVGDGNGYKFVSYANEF